MSYLLHAFTANYMHAQLSIGTRSVPFSTSKLCVCDGEGNGKTAWI